MGLVAWATLFGIAQAQFEEPVGAVKLGAPAFNGGQAIPPGPVNVNDFGNEPVPNGSGSIYGMTQVDRLFTPRVNIDSRGGGLYGYQAGYSNIGLFVPYKLDQDSILFVHGMGLITYDGRGGATVGTGWRHYIDGLDRIIGLSGWFDFDNGHSQPYQQLGLSFESLGRYVDIRGNGYIPVSNADHILYSQVSMNAILTGNNIGLIRNSTIEQSYSGFDAEIGGPTPILGRYGLNAYIGGYYFTGNGVSGGDFTGVSGRILSQINEDVQFGVQVTDDHVFGLNTQFQVFVNLPDGKSSRWFRNPTVHDRLVQNVFRQNRVIARTQNVQTVDLAIDPATHKPYFVANINPNLGSGQGNGSITNPYGSVAQYEAASLSQRKMYDIILVQPRSDSTTTNLDTSNTLVLFDNQRLLSTSIAHTFTTENVPGKVFTMPGFTGGASPMLYNSSGAAVITLNTGSKNIEVSGFNIAGSSTGSGIVGSKNSGVNINNNEIHGGLNGVLLNNLSGSFGQGSEFQLTSNNIHNNIVDGVQVTNSSMVSPLDVLVQSNTFSTNGNDGLKFVAQSGGTIGGIIGGPPTSTTPSVVLANTFKNNGTSGSIPTGNGLDLVANGGTLNFASAPGSPAFGIPNGAFGIYNNVFTGNILDGLHINATNNSTSRLNIAANTFGLASTKNSGNGRYGIGIAADSGTTDIEIGGAITKTADGVTNNPGNTFNYTVVDAINIAVTGTAGLTYDISNNTITNVPVPNVPPAVDAFTFSFSGVSGTDPFILTNTSTPSLNQVQITSMLWNLAGNTNATFASPSNNSVVVQPLPAFAQNLLTAVNGVAVSSNTNPLVLTTAGAPPASYNNLNLPNGGSTLPLTFGNGNFTQGVVFEATARQQLSTSLTPLKSINSLGSTVTVGFSDNNSATAILTATDGVGISGTGTFVGNLSAGFGAGVDGVHISSSGASVVHHSTIESNSITGMGGYGIHVETSGTSNAADVTIANNNLQSNGSGNTLGYSGLSLTQQSQLLYTGGGIGISRSDDSTLGVLVDSNIIRANFNDGIDVTSTGSGTGGLSVNSKNNLINNSIVGSFNANACNGIKLSASGASVLTFNSIDDIVSGNGYGAAQNKRYDAGDNIAIETSDTAIANVSFQSLAANDAFRNGLSSTLNGHSTLNLTLDGPTLETSSSVVNNRGSGLKLSSNDTSYLNVNIYSLVATNNLSSGVEFDRSAASLVNASISDSRLQSNGVNGLLFEAAGSDPHDPTQQFTGTPNRISLTNDVLDNNGANGVGQGARLDLFGDSVLVLNAKATSFDSNAQNGIRVKLTPGASFGYAGVERSILDNVDISSNGANGFFITSDITRAQSGNGFLPFDAPSNTYMQISSDSGNTVINRNGLNGILAQYTGGNHDILLKGSSSTYTTVIQTNGQDGVHSEAGIEAKINMLVDGVVIGGPAVVNANGGDGIDFEVQSVITVVDGGPLPSWNFNGAGIGTLNVQNNTLIQNNLGNGINLIGNDLTDAARTSNTAGDSAGHLNATVTGSQILNNKLGGVSIELLGRMGSRSSTNTFNFTGNTISNNGNFGVFFESNAANQRINPGNTINEFYRVISFQDPQPTTPVAFPFDPNNLINVIGNNGWNEGTSSGLIFAADQSNWMNLFTASNSSLVMNSNTIQGNGANHNLQAADGVFIRVGTNSYLSADVQSNTISGNVANDLHIESFDAYTPGTGVVIQPLGSQANAAPTPDIVVLDNTAQMDLRLLNNQGNTVNIVNPGGANYAANGGLLGNTTPNGAVYQAEGLKDNFSLTNPSPRITQLFQVDNSANALGTNTFIGQTSGTQNLSTIFTNSDWHKTTTSVFGSLLFPQNYLSNSPQSNGNPFLP